jgi:cytochrome b
MSSVEGGTDPHVSDAAPRDATGAAGAVRVWDLPTRLFHWGLVALITTSVLSGWSSHDYFSLHRWSGYAIAALLLFRLTWGLFGTEHARFAAFVRGPATVMGYARDLLRLRPPASLGHNPLGGWSIVAMLAMIAAIIATGLLGRSSSNAGPLARMVSRSTARLFNEIHEALTDLLLVVIAVHLMGVLIDWWLTRDNLIRAMIDGRKWPHGPAADYVPVAAWRAPVLLALAVALVWAIVNLPGWL